MKRTILAVDGSKAIRFLLQNVFERKYKVVTASDAASAMYWLSRNELPDAIIADPQLPDTENWELLEHLTSSGLYSDIPLVVLSSLNKAEIAAKCQELSVAHYFSQPFNPVDLVNCVDKMFTGISKSTTKLKAV